jgi:hypothetical protein
MDATMSNLETIECPGCRGYGTYGDDDARCPLCSGSGWALLDPTPVDPDILAAINADTEPVDPGPFGDGHLDPADLVANVDGSYTLDPVDPGPADPVDPGPAPAPRITSTANLPDPGARWRGRFGALVDSDRAMAPVAPVADTLGIDPSRGTVNPCRRADLMRAFVGTVVGADPVRANGHDYLLLRVDCAGLVIAARFRADRCPPVGTVVYLRGTPLGADDADVVRLSGPRSLRVRLDTDPAPGVHRY